MLESHLILLTCSNMKPHLLNSALVPVKFLPATPGPWMEPSQNFSTSQQTPHLLVSKVANWSIYIFPPLLSYFQPIPVPHLQEGLPSLLMYTIQQQISSQSSQAIPFQVGGTLGQAPSV